MQNVKDDYKNSLKLLKKKLGTPHNKLLKIYVGL